MKQVVAIVEGGLAIVDGVTKVGIELVKAAIALLAAGAFGVIAWSCIKALFQ